MSRCAPASEAQRRYAEQVANTRRRAAYRARLAAVTDAALDARLALSDAQRARLCRCARYLWPHPPHPTVLRAVLPPRVTTGACARARIAGYIGRRP